MLKKLRFWFGGASLRGLVSVRSKGSKGKGKASHPLLVIPLNEDQDDARDQDVREEIRMTKDQD